ncbi:MAG: TRAP transporter small permease [Pseudomonadota bacterium]
MHMLMMRLARVMASLGGLVLLILVLMTCLSILGREAKDLLQTIDTGWSNALINLGIDQVRGDFEMVEAGMAFAIFAFLPLCQMTSGHATVDVFTDRLPERAKRWLAAVIEVIFALVLVLIAVQLLAGMQSKIRTGQTSFILAFPVWWGYAAALVGALVAALSGVYMAVMRVMEAAAGRALIPAAEGAEH